MVAPEPEVLDVCAPGEWEAWLEQYHEDRPEGVWLRLFNKAAARDCMSWAEAVEVALCFGWIDGQARRHDEVSRVQRFTPRRARSVWSKVNTERVERLVEAGRMRAAGLREVEVARADGRWAAAYDPPSRATIPDDFLAALREHPKAEAFFATLDRRNTYPIVYRLQTARTPETRERRLRAIIQMLERGERFYD